MREEKDTGELGSRKVEEISYGVSVFNLRI